MSSAPQTITLIRGDGIGPEVADAVLSILEASGAPLRFEEVVVGREAEKAGGDPPARRAPRIDPPQPRRPQGARRHPVGKGFAVGQRPAAPEARALRQPAARQEPPDRREPLPGRRPRRRPGEHRGPLQRARAHRRARGRRVAQDHHGARLDPHRPVRLRVRPARAAASGSRPIHKANIMKLSDGLFLDCFRKVAEDYPRHRGRRPDRGRRLHAAGHEPGDLRRAAAREPLRRHRLGPRRRPRRRPRAGSRGQPRAEASRSSRPSTGPRRTSPGQDKANPTALLDVARS